MKYLIRKPGALAPILVPAILFAAQPWSHKDPQQWSRDDVNRLLLDSPWAQQTAVTFGIKPEEEPAPQQLPAAATAGLPGQQQGQLRWDGGVGRNDKYNTPVLNVTVRWDSALPERQALARQRAIDAASAPPYGAEDAQKDYIITVLGLVPAGRYRSMGSPETVSTSDDSVDSRNPEPLLEGFMTNSALVTRRGSIRPKNAQLDAPSGVVHLFFPRSQAITLNDKEVLFETRFGSLTVSRKFRLKDMVYAGKLEL